MHYYLSVNLIIKISLFIILYTCVCIQQKYSKHIWFLETTQQQRQLNFTLQIIELSERDMVDYMGTACCTAGVLCQFAVSLQFFSCSGIHILSHRWCNTTFNEIRSEIYTVSSLCIRGYYISFMYRGCLTILTYYACVVAVHFLRTLLLIKRCDTSPLRSAVAAASQMRANLPFDV